MPKLANPERPLTHRRQARLNAFLSDYPQPDRLLARSFPKTFRYALRGGGLTMEEVRSCCFAGARRAAALYDRRRGFKFSTYAAWHMRGHVTRDIERRAKDRASAARVVSGDAATSWDLFGVTAKSDDPGEPDRQRAIRDRVHEALRFLPADQRRVVELRFGLGDRGPLMLEAIARELGLTRERVRQIELKALARLGNLLDLVADELIG